VDADLLLGWQMTREVFAHFLNDRCSPARMRAGLPAGFDRALCKELARNR